MTEAATDKVQIKYKQQYRELKQILLAKHFSGEDSYVLPSAERAHIVRASEAMPPHYLHTGQAVLQKVDVDGVEITFTEGPPLKKFVTPAKLSADLAK